MGDQCLSELPYGDDASYGECKKQLSTCLNRTKREWNGETIQISKPGLSKKFVDYVKINRNIYAKTYKDQCVKSNKNNRRIYRQCLHDLMTDETEFDNFFGPSGSVIQKREEDEFTFNSCSNCGESEDVYSYDQFTKFDDVYDDIEEHENELYNYNDEDVYYC